MSTKKKEKTIIEPVVPKFKKEALLRAKRYAQYRDLLNALLDDEEEYTAKEVADKVDGFLKGKVN